MNSKTLLSLPPCSELYIKVQQGLRFNIFNLNSLVFIMCGQSEINEEVKDLMYVDVRLHAAPSTNIGTIDMIKIGCEKCLCS